MDCLLMMPFSIMMMPLIADLFGVFIHFLPAILFAALIAYAITSIWPGTDNQLSQHWEHVKEKCYSTLQSIRQQINQTCSSNYHSNYLPTDLFEKDDSYIIEIDLPGMNKEDIKVEIEDNTVTISGQRTNDGMENRFSSRIFGPFNKTITLPEPADTQTMIAKYENGVLTLIVNKKTEYLNRKKNIVISFSLCFTPPSLHHQSTTSFPLLSTQLPNSFVSTPFIDYQYQSTTQRTL